MTARRTAALSATWLVASAMTVTTYGSSAAAAKGADLEVGSVAPPPAKAAAGGSFKAKATVANTGRAAAGPSTVQFFLSKDRARSSDDVAGGTAKVARLAPKDKATAAASIAVPQRARGSYWVIACADARKQVTESNESNNCRTAAKPVEVGGELHATLTGDLTFTEYRQTTDPATGATTTVDHAATAEIVMTVDGDPIDPTFASTNSTYTRIGTTTRHEVDADCVMHRERTVKGEGELTYTGDPYNDDIYGSITKTDLSGVHLGINLRASWTETDTHTGQGADPCDPFSKTTTGAELTVNDIDFVEISRTSSAIRYRVESFLGEMGTTSRWDEVEGILTLTLDSHLD